MSRGTAPKGIRRGELVDLAIFGPASAFSRERCVGEPNIGDVEAFVARVRGALASHRLTNGGPLVSELETRFTQMTGVEHAVAVCNATVGIQLVARALEMAGEIIVPSFTFVGTAHALQWVGATPVFSDVDPITHTLDPDAVKRALNPRTQGILGVHLWGQPCDIEALKETADAAGIPLIFDAAHALGCARGGVPVGGFGDAEIFSLHATKVAGAGEGGVITTGNADLADRLRQMRNFGFVGYDAVAGLGTNGKMSELSAALALTSLDALDVFIETNRRHYESYTAALDGLAGISFHRIGDGDRQNYHYVVIEIDEATTEISRDDVMRVLHAENILARRYFYPGCHRLPPYNERSWNLPVTESLCDRVLVLPTGMAVGDEDVATICSVVGVAVTNGRELSAAMKELPASQLTLG